MNGQILELAAQRSTAAETFHIDSVETPISFESGELKSAETKAVSGTALRLVAGERLGFASSTRSDQPADLVNRASATADFGAPVEWILPPLREHRNPRIHDPALEDATAESLASMAAAGLKALKEIEPEARYDATVNRRVSRVALRNSSGFEGSYDKTVLSLQYSAQWIRGEDMLQVHAADATCRKADLTRPLVRHIAQRLLWAKYHATIRPGTWPVVFSAKAFAVLVLGLRAALSGRLVDQGSSPFTGRLGETLFDSALTVMDHPLLDWAPGSVPWDDEGVASRSTVLVQNGKLSGFYVDLHSAVRLGMPPTGNGLRSGLSELPAPGIHNMVVQPGRASFDQMTRDIRYGLMVDQLIGAGQGNIVGGDFSLNLGLGYLIDQGEIVGRVKNAMISGNIYKLLQNIRQLGCETKWTRMGYFPDICLDGINVVAG